MRKKNWMIGCLTVILVGLIGVLCMMGFSKVADWHTPGLYIQVESGGKTEQIRLWKNSDGVFYAFLPGYADLEDTFLISAGERERVADMALEDRISCKKFALNTEYSLSYYVNNMDCTGIIVFVQSGGVASLYIDVDSGSMDYIHMDKNNRETGSLRLYGADGSTYCTANLTEVKGRGNTSWDANKKPYNLTLDQEVDILGMGAAKNWVLLAEGYNVLNIRDKIVYDFADKAGIAWSPDCEWVDLYLNGEYSGLYLLSERNEIHKERINIAQVGSFVVSQEYEDRLKEQKYPYVTTKSGQTLRIRYGESNTSWLQHQWQTVENAILAEDGRDPVSGVHWRELIDVDSWAKKYLIEEVFGNLDGGSLSQYYYIDGNNHRGTIYAGPVWDYDFAMGGENVWLRPYTSYFTMNRVHVNEDVYTPWYPALYQQSEFLDYVKEVYARDFVPLLQELTSTGIMDYWMEIQSAAWIDGIRWNIDWEEISVEPDYIKAFLIRRVEFLTDLWINESNYHTIQVDTGRNGLYGCFAVKDGELLPQLTEAEEPGGLGWYHVDTDEPYDVTAPVHEDARIYMKTSEKGLPVIHYAPMTVLIMAALLLVLLDVVQIKNRRKGNDAVSNNEIPA